MVQHVEELRAELQLQRLVNREDANDARIPRRKLRPNKAALHDVAVGQSQVRRVRRIRGEVCLVQPVLAVRSRSAPVSAIRILPVPRPTVL